MKIVLIRHSKTYQDPNTPILQWGLSEAGMELARQLSQLDIIKNLSVVYASFQTKALETAVLLAKPNALPIKPNDGLTEVTSFTGQFEPDFAKYTKNVHDYYLGNIERIGSGETKVEALARFNATLERIAAEEIGKEYIGVVSHGNVLSLFSAQYSPIGSYELHLAIKQPDIAVFDWEKKQFISFFGESLR